MAIIGLDIGGTKILGAIFDKNGVIIDKEKRPSKGEEGFEVFMDQVYKVIKRLKKRSEEKIEGIGIGFPGIVDKNGFVVFSPNLPIQKFDLANHLEEKYGIPVVLGNDVNCGTYGEYHQLDMKADNVVGLFPGTGLGGGIVINGELYIGQGFAGELGHIVVQKDGVECSCGNKGCLESYASKKGIISYVKSQLVQGRKSILEEDINEGIIKSSKLKEAIDQHDKLALEAMHRFEEYLGMGIGIIMNIFNPDVILIGGGIIESFGEDLLSEIRIFAKHHALPGMYNNSKIQMSKLGDDSVIYGGYHLIKNRLEK